ncbi:MAG: hypothetical protein KatS3mg051_1806 [Anaerolineae bacterium]|nr:MAG: hypothetical protein KatS3mg051_1408 [Anaerolineae bacterium]GIV82452.1 MAG: hypothetical protein KatS3mg051_1806 [Anaerolineae bacterium]
MGADQLQALLTHPDLPFGQELCVVVGDASYGKRGFLVCQSPFPNLVLIARLRNNRVCYRPPVVQGPGARGRPCRYGPRFALNDPVTWPVADQEERFQVTSAQGRCQQVHLQAWHDMRMRGTQEWPLHAHPFTLVRIQVTDEEGKPLHRRPLWLLVMGPRRHELSLRHIYTAYTQRATHEQYHRFSKQRLLATPYQTPDAAREERWWRLTQLAYFQLWLARPLALPRPWERYLPRMAVPVPSPSLVQRDFGRLIRQLGTPARTAKLRGKSPGRRKGTYLPPRMRHPVVRKTVRKGYSSRSSGFSHRTPL